MKYRIKLRRSVDTDQLILTYQDTTTTLLVRVSFEYGIPITAASTRHVRRLMKLALDKGLERTTFQRFKSALKGVYQAVRYRNGGSLRNMWQHVVYMYRRGY